MSISTGFSLAMRITSMSHEFSAAWARYLRCPRGMSASHVDERSSVKRAPELRPLPCHDPTATISPHRGCMPFRVHKG
eukprot:1173777-Prorocentrum_minimum.AAC.4